MDKNWKWSCKSVGRKVSVSSVLLPSPREPCLGFPLAQLIRPWVRAGGAQTDLLASSFLSFPSELLEVPALKGFPSGPLLLMLLLEW